MLFHIGVYSTSHYSITIKIHGESIWQTLRWKYKGNQVGNGEAGVKKI